MSKSSVPMMLVATASLFACVSTGMAEPAAQSIATAPVAAAPVPAASPTVSLTQGQSSHFQDALTSLTMQGHIAVVAEGAPLHPHLAGAAIPDLTTPMPISRALTTLGAAYDYDVQRQEGGVFVLTKRYSDPRDLPCVTLAECQASLQDVLQILDTFSPHFQGVISGPGSGPDTQRDAILSFFNSLSPAQIAAAQSKTLRYGDLLPDQQRPIWGIMMYQFVQMPFDKTQAQINDLTQVSHMMLAAHNEYKQAGVYREVPAFSGSTQKMFIPLPGELSGFPTDADGKQITQPPEWLAVAPLVLTGAPKPLTLAEAVASLQPIHKQQAVVDKPLQAKLVTVAGLANADPMKVLEALKKLYGLRIGASDKSAPMLARQILTIPDNLRDIAPDVWLALPVSYTRAMDADARPKAAHKPAPLWMQLGTDGIYDQEKSRLDEAVGENQCEAVRRLRLAMQPQLKMRGPDARVPASSLTEEDRDILAVALIGQTVLYLRDALSGASTKRFLSCLDEINDMTISTVPSETAHRNGVAIPSLYMDIHHSGPGGNEIMSMGSIRYVGDY